MDDIPEIEASLPEPDFFDAIDNETDLLPTQILESPVSQQLPPESILECVRGAELKYDDELCEFNEFMIGFESWGDKKPNDGVMAVKASSSVQRLEGGEEQDKLTHKKILAQNQNMISETSDDNRPTTPRAAKDNDVIPSSGPDTPESRAGSTVVRLCLPTIPKVRSTNKKISPVKKTSPSSSVKGGPGSRNILSNKRETRGKRKLSEEEDLEYEPDDEEDAELDDNRFKTKSRSGRPIRKTARYGDDDEDDSDGEDSPNVNVTTTTRSTRQKRNSTKHENDEDTRFIRKSKTRSGRTARKLNRYGFENGDEEEKLESENCTDEQDEVNSIDSEILFEPVSKKRKSTKYWIDDEGVTFFDDGNGIIHKLNPLKILLTRLTEAEIDKIKHKEETLEEDDTQYNPFLLEVCVDNFISVVEAVKGGAKRIELCSSLSEGGLTPTGGFLTSVKERFPDLPVFVMIRPRGGDFVYSPDEIEIMNRDISHYKQMGADGFVFGVLTNDCKIDLENCKLLKQMAFPLECTFHRAFDKVSNPFSALETIISMGFNRILTSGQAATAHVGIPMLRRLVEAAGSRITILAGAGLNQQNVGEIVRKTGVKEVHGSASKLVASKMCAPGPSKSPKRSSNKISAVKMGSTDDSVIKVTDSQLVAQIVRNGRKHVKR